MKFVDLEKQYLSIQNGIGAALNKVLQHGQFILGPEVTELENTLKSYIGSQYAIATSSGTDALLAALLACDIQAGDEIIIPAFSFFATAEVVSLLGAIPIFIDIDPLTYNIDPNLIESHITKKTKAIMPVSLFGQAAEMDEINSLAQQYELFVIEDAAQSFGGTYKTRMSGNLSHIGCTSFFPAKPLGAYGDAGMCFTDDATLADKIRVICNHGQASRYHHVQIGLNARLDTLQAAILLEKFKLFEKELAIKTELAKYYDKCLNDIITCPSIRSYNTSAHAQYTVRSRDRESIRTFLQTHNIPTAVHYPSILPEQPVYQKSRHAGKHNHFPRAKSAANEVFSLPLHPYMSEKDIEHIAQLIMEVSSKKE